MVWKGLDTNKKNTNPGCTTCPPYDTTDDEPTSNELCANNYVKKNVE